MRILVILGMALLAVEQCTAPPVIEKKKETKEHAKEEFDDELSAMEYSRYLQEVVTALEKDPHFRAKLINASEDEIKSGKFAGELEFVNHTVRTQLDELKRNELERLLNLRNKEYEQQNGLDLDHLKIPEHIDHENPHTFEVTDLKKLITKTTKDLAEVDRQRREKFKEYEMQKRYDEEQRKLSMSEEEKKKYEEQLKAEKNHRKEHKPIHHPGSKQQLEEVWKESDHMDGPLEPRSFFYMHDLDANDVWDEDEVKALFLKELDKIYGPEADKVERHEEMELMREELFNETDTNGDRLISYDEYMERLKKSEGLDWQSMAERQIYDEQVYQKFSEQRHREEMQRRANMGIPPSGHDSYDPGHQQQFQPQYNNIPVDHAGLPHPDFVPPMGARDHQQQYPGQIQHQQFEGHHPQFQGQHPQFQGQQPQFQDQHPQYQGQPQVPQYQGHPAQGQLPQQNYQQGYMQQPHQGQIPPQQHGQIPQYQQGQIPQHQQGQIPQQQQGQIPQHQQGQIPQQQQGQIPQHQQGQIPQQQQGQIPQYQQGQISQQQQGQIPQQQQGQIPPQQQGQIPQQQQGQIPPQQQGQIPQQQQGQIPQQQQVQGQVAAQQQKQQQQQSVPIQQQQNTQEKLPSSNQVPQVAGQNSLPVMEKAPQGGNVAAARSPNVIQT